MRHLSSVVCITMLCITFQSIHTVDSFAGAAIGVVSGIMGIFDFLKNRYEELNSSKASGSSSNLETERILWRNQLAGDIENIQSAIDHLPNKQAFSDKLNWMRETFLDINDDHKVILEECPFVRDEHNAAIVTKSKADECHIIAQEIFAKYKTKRPLLKIHQTIQSALKNYTIIAQSSWIEEYQNYSNVCATRVSSLQAVSRLLEDVVWTSSYYYNVVKMSRKILGTSDANGNDAELARISEWYKDTIAALQPTLRQMSRRLYRCGLPELSDKGAAIEFNLAKKVFFRRSKDTAADEDDWPQCWAIPLHLFRDEVTICPEEKTLDQGVCRVSSPCAGKLYDCEDAYDVKAVCVSDSADERRYQYYYGPSGKAMASNSYSKCHEMRMNYAVQMDYEFDVHFIKHNPCHCMCEEEKEYYINKSPVMSAYGENKVIVGAKFVLTSGNVFEVHIQEGKLLANGVIDVPKNKPLSWITPPKKDLKQLSLKEARKIRLGESILKTGDVLVGLKLSFSTTNGKVGLSLDVFGAEFNFATGDITSSARDHPQQLPQNTFNLANADSPREASERSRVTVEFDDTYTEFATSGGKDAGQTTIPFFDGQEVTSNIPSPMSGAGLYWKGKQGTGGFVAIVLSTYDIVPYITSILIKE